MTVNKLILELQKLPGTYEVVVALHALPPPVLPISIKLECMSADISSAVANTEEHVAYIFGFALPNPVKDPHGKN
jgi:hypothetical protein